MQQKLQVECHFDQAEHHVQRSYRIDVPGKSGLAKTMRIKKEPFTELEDTVVTMLFQNPHAALEILEDGRVVDLEQLAASPGVKQEPSVKSEDVKVQAEDVKVKSEQEHELDKKHDAKNKGKSKHVASARDLSSRFVGIVQLSFMLATLQLRNAAAISYGGEV